MSQVLDPSCPKLSNFGTDRQVKSHIQVDRYQIVRYSRQSKPTYLTYLLTLFFDIFRSFPMFIMTEFSTLDNMRIFLI